LVERGLLVETLPGSSAALTLEGDGRNALRQPEGGLDCGNSGTTMRLLAGLAAGLPFRTELTGDESLRSRPMDRVAEPLGMMGARIVTDRGHAPLVVRGGRLRGIRYALPVPSAQVKGAILLAALSAEGETTVVEPASTRDHTERALLALGAPVRSSDGEVTVGAFQLGGFEARVPGDPSSAAFLLGAAAVCDSPIRLRDVGLNPTRTRFVDVLARMGLGAEIVETDSWVGEPVGNLEAARRGDLVAVTVESPELPLVIDEVPVLAAVAAHAIGESRFEGAGELRVKETDRLTGMADGLRALGGEAWVDGDALVVAGGGLTGGRADARSDHRLAMALAVAALGATGPCEITGAEWVDVSFPGFGHLLKTLGASVEAFR
jgi:3-phosphoshikimate 1-carboxyvinyltransferase